MNTREKIHLLRNLHVRRMTAVSLIAAFVNLRTVCESELKSGPKFNAFITVTPSVRKHIEINCRLNTFQRRLKSEDSLCLVSRERHLAPLWHFSATLASEINVVSYLLTYLC